MTLWLASDGSFLKAMDQVAGQQGMNDSPFHFPAHEGRIVPVAAHGVGIQLPDKVGVEDADIGRCPDRQGPEGQAQDAGGAGGQAVYQFIQFDDMRFDETKAHRQQGIESRDAGFR